MPLWNELTHKKFLMAASKTEVVVMVTGSLEAHGDHLPLGTDTMMPEYLAQKVAQETNALVLPALPIGNSWTFTTFEGTLSLKAHTIIDLYTDIMESVFAHGFKYLIVLNGHGGNVSAIQLAAQRATQQGERVVILVNWWIDLGKAAREEVLETYEGHAAEDETSEVMYVRPELVDMSSVMAARTDTRFRIISGAYREELYQSAIWGDPRTATPEKGKRIVDEAVEELIELIHELEKGKLPLSH
ncbi:MAG: creatininase family protein [Candidatus Thorarchaeota archaeon]|nr:creatininase family protein [Candidatus Thorarchaeota archaeon]